MPDSARIQVLFADPDESLLAIYREFLRDDFKVVTARNGVECLARLRERAPDVLVLEPRLPWGGGDGVLEVMHAVPDLTGVPVMILTSCRDCAVLEGVAPFRISDYFAKPLSPVRLASRIRTVLEHNKSSKPAAGDQENGPRSSEKGAAFVIL